MVFLAANCQDFFLGYLAHVGAAVEFERKEKGGDKAL
jgi:hypothetical protein